MEEQGDDLEAERVIEHFTYFKSKTAAEEFKAWAIAGGFTPREEIYTIDGSFGFRFFGLGQGTEIPEVAALLEDQA